MTTKNNDGNGFAPDVETTSVEARVMPLADAWIRKAFEDALLKARASELWATPPVTEAERDAFNALPRKEKEDVLNKMLARVNYFINGRDMLRMHALEAEQSVRRGEFRVRLVSFTE